MSILCYCHARDFCVKPLPSQKEDKDAVSEKFHEHIKDLVVPQTVEEVIEEKLNKLSFLDNNSPEFRLADKLCIAQSRMLNVEFSDNGHSMQYEILVYCDFAFNQDIHARLYMCMSIACVMQTHVVLSISTLIG